MNQYQDSAGRGIEVIVGIITSFIAVVFILLIALISKEATLGYAPIIGSLVLLLLAYWFGLISYRLLFNKSRKTGGLLSPMTLKALCLVFGFCSILVTIFALIAGEYNGAVSAAIMVPACWYGWQLANKRQSGNGI